jgi:type IV pilus assembly protein PilP
VAQQTPQQDQVVNPVPIEIKKSADTFEYQIEGRPDPFLPFITERASSNENPDEIVDRDQVLTGMQLFEPGQLTLVALMVAGSNKYAMVQDFTGKGYVIEEGTKIGRRGVVADIVENRIIIEEQALTRGGKTLINKIAMVLKKEGEE